MARLGGRWIWLKRQPVALYIGTLVLLGGVSFGIEKASPRWQGLSTVVVLLVTAVVFLLQHDEMRQTRRGVEEERQERLQPKLRVDVERSKSRLVDSIVTLLSDGPTDVDATLDAISTVKIDGSLVTFRAKSPLDGMKSLIVGPGESYPVQVENRRGFLNRSDQMDEGAVPEFLDKVGRSSSPVPVHLEIRVCARSLSGARDTIVKRWYWVRDLVPGDGVWYREADSAELYFATR